MATLEDVLCVLFATMDRIASKSEGKMKHHGPAAPQVITVPYPEYPRTGTPKAVAALHNARSSVASGNPDLRLSSR